MAAVALAAAALSYQSLAHLGVLAGYGSLSILYPLVVDAGAAASCAAWLHTRGRQPLVMTWALLAVSVVLNAVEHYLQSTHTAPSWLLVVAVAAVPPTVLGLCVHLAVGLGATPLQLHGGMEEQRYGGEAPALRQTIQRLLGEEIPVANPHGVNQHSGLGGTKSCEPDANKVGHAGPGRGHKTVGDTNRLMANTENHVVSRLKRDDPELAAKVISPDPVAELLAAGAGRRKVAEALGVSEHRAKQLIAASRNGHVQ